MSMLDTMSNTSTVAPVPDTTTHSAWLPTLHQIRQAILLRMKPKVVFVPAAETPVQPTLFELENEGEQVQNREPGIAREAAGEEETLETVASETARETPSPAGTSGPQRVVTSVVTAEHPLAISMRQGLLLLVLSALLAGLLPFIWNWYSAVQFDTVTPFVPAARFVAQQADIPRAPDSNLTVLVDTAGTLVGLEPYWPVGLAAGLTALGEWINWPLRWLSIWLVYGLGVFVICKLFGTTTTLQHFFAATSYAAVPLLLTGLYFVPVLGVLAVLAGAVWGVLVYAHAVRAVAGLNIVHAALSVVAPAGIVSLVSFFATIGLLAFVYSLLL